MRLVDRDAEFNLVAALLRTPAAVFDLGDKLQPQHFSDPALAAIFGVLSQSKGEAVDALSLRATLTADGRWTDRIAGAADAAFKHRAPGKPADAAKIVHTLAVRRALREAAAAIDALAVEDGITSADALERAEAAISEAAKRGDSGGPRWLREYVVEAIENLSRAMTGKLLGVSTGFPALDDMTNGIQAGWLTVIGGRTSHGKSALGVQTLGFHVATSQEAGCVLVFSMEMQGWEIAQRRIQSKADVTAKYLRWLHQNRGSIPSEVGQRLAHESEAAAGVRMAIDDEANLTADRLCQRARRFQAQNPDLSLIVVDNLQNFPVRGENKAAEYARVTGRLKQLAKELGVPVVLLVQLGRGLDRENREPVLSDLKDSGGTEQDADCVLLIHRYGDPREDPERKEWPVKLIVAKGRGEGVGWVRSWFWPRKTEFVPVPAGDETRWDAEVGRIEEAP
jgi:replicative DNA helicase